MIGRGESAAMLTALWVGDAWGRKVRMDEMYTDSAEVYDAIYSARIDFATATERLHGLIEQHKQTSGTTLLDVACGTGAYLTHLRTWYAVEGLDLAPDMLAVARRKEPDVPFHESDMADFDLGRRYDALICLSSSIGYVKTIPRLRQTLQTFARHLVPGGVAIVGRWFTPDEWIPGHQSAELIEEPDRKIARMNVSSQDGRLSIMDMHYLVATAHGIEHFTERHEMGLFTRDEYLAAFEAAGLDVVDEAPSFLPGRSLYIAVAPADIECCKGGLG
jgi:ubiquinone/menaquinone biosynthesis C-methylase UbiE